MAGGGLGDIEVAVEKDVGSDATRAQRGASRK